MIKEAVILAAGLSTRLRWISPTTPKFALRFGSCRLIEFPIRALAGLGVERFVIVSSSAFLKHVEEIVESLCSEGLEFEIVVNRHPERGNGYSFLLSSEAVTSSKFILSMCDHVYTPRLVKEAVEKFECREADVVLAGDGFPRYVNVWEATKVLADGDKMVKIGKDLEKFTHVDTGVFVVREDVFELRRELEKFEGELQLSRVIQSAIDHGYGAYVANVSAMLWTEIDTVEDLIDALRGRRLEVLKLVGREVGCCV